MTTEVWFRNPSNYIRECVEQGAHLVAWDRGYLVKKKVDPERFGNLYYPSVVDYRMLLIGDQGTAEVRRGRPMTNPVAVYPTWIYGHDTMRRLEDLLANPVGEDPAACGDGRLEPDERPVLGQEHRVVISDTPSARTGIGQAFYGLLREMQEEFPDAILHVHGLYSYNYAFGNGYRSVDIDARTLASKGKVTLPCGKEVTYEKAGEMPQWVHVVGFKLPDLEVPRNRCMFNIRSAWWAAEHFDENFKFRVSPNGAPAIDPNDPSPPPLSTNGVHSSPPSATVGDKFACDTCSLYRTCKYFRSGSVCSLPDSDGAKLAKHFNTRSSADIIEGIGALMGTQLERMERGLRIEKDFRTEDGDERLDPEVTKIIEHLIKDAALLAKLVDPALARPAQVNVGVQVNGPAGLPTGATPQELASRAVLMLEAQGYTRDDMTPQMIEDVIAGRPVPLPVGRVIDVVSSTADG